MLRKVLLPLLLSSTWLMSCQSTRPTSFLPRASEYGPLTSSPTTPVSADSGTIELSASLTDTPPAPAPAAPRHQVTKPVLPVAAPRHTAEPDTALERLLRPDPVIKPDPLTTGVNVFGALATVGGIGFTIAAVDGNEQNKGSFYPVVQVVVGIGLLAIGIPLLFFQGKNGRMRRLREARKATSAPTPPASASKKGKANAPLAKLGLGLAIAGGVLLLLGLLLGGLGAALVFIPAAILILIGLILFVAGA